MANKSKSRKKRKKTDQNLNNLSANELVLQGKSSMASGNYRQAVQFLKIAHKREPDDQHIRLLLFRAYALRQDQLRRKGFEKEADALCAQIRQYRPPMEQMDPADLCICLKSTSPDDAVDLYGRFLDCRKPVREAEMVIAGVLLRSSQWQAAAQLPDKALMKPDLPVLQKAARLMEAARWETALECLQPIARNSPLAPVRMLCRAMVCFYQKDDPGMQRALAMIPPSFGLFPLVERLMNSPQSLSPLWQGGFIDPEQIRLLLRAVDDMNFNGAARWIKQIAQSIRPRDPQPAIEQLLHILWLRLSSQALDLFPLEQMVASLLPKKARRSIIAKFQFLAFTDDLEAAADYLEQLDAEFPDRADREVAASMVLTESVARIASNGMQTMAADLPQKARQRLGITTGRQSCAMLEMTLKALELDPQNPRILDLLTRLPRDSRKAKGLAEAGLLKLADSIPEDPRPCIALSDLYSEKNAFRKAEHYLRQAEQRAPHDAQVKDFRVLALIRSIDTNLKRRKRHLVQSDLEAAARLCNPKTRPHIAARRILFAIDQTGQLSLFDDQVVPDEKGRIRAVIESHITALPGVERLRTLVVLWSHSRLNPETWNRAKSGGLKTALHRQASTADALPSQEIRDLMVPDAIIRTQQGAAPYWIAGLLDHYKKILQKLRDEDVLPVIEVMLEVGRTRQCLQEIQRRLKTVSEPLRSLMLFYRLVMRCITGHERADGEVFENIIDQAPDHQREMLRSAARRLAKAARPPLRTALENFDFRLLDDPDAPPFWPDATDGDDPEGFDSLDIDAHGAAKAILDDLEDLVDTTGLRGAPVKVLKKRRKEMMNNFQMRMFFSSLVDLLPPDLTGELSPEARVLIFG